MTGISQVAFPGKADGSQIEASTARSSARPSAGCIDGKDADGNAITRLTRVLPAAAVADGLQRQRHLLLQPRAEPGRRAVLLPRPARRLPGARGPLRPRPDQREGPGRRGHHVGVRRRPAHLRRPTPRIQAHRIAAVRGLPLARVDAAHRRQHRRALPRRPRRARRERPRAQPRPRQGSPRPMSPEAAVLAPCFSRELLWPALARVAAQARPARAGPQPGHVRGRGRRGDHHRRVADPALRRRPARRRQRAAPGSPSRSRSGCG